MPKRVSFLLIILLLFSSAFCFADWSNQSRLAIYKYNVVDNGNVLINLAEDTTQTIENPYTSYGTVFNGNLDSRHLSVFRIEENLVANGNPSGGVLVTVSCEYEDANGWYFVNENNSTSRRHFGLNVSEIKRNRQGGGWGNSPTYNTMTNDSPKKIKTGSSGELEFRMSYTTYERPILLSVFAASLFDYDVGIYLPPTESYDYLEPGYYITKLKVSIEGYKIHSAAAVSGNVKEDGTVEADKYYMTIRAYVGDNGLTIDLPQTSFIVGSGDDTYTMKLNPSERSKDTYSVAHVNFFHSESNSSKTSNGSEKYVILISPTRDYFASYESTDKPYFFRKYGTDYSGTASNTVYYIICNAAGTELTKKTGGSFPSSNNKSWTYQIKATYNNPSRNTTTNKYDEEWTIDEEIYLKIDDDGVIQYEPGIYFSYIYFTLMTN